MLRLLLGRLSPVCPRPTSAQPSNATSSQWLFPMALAWLPGTVGLPVTDVSCFVLAPQFPRFLCHCWCQPLGCKRHRDRDSVRRRPAPTGVFTAAASRARGSASRREREVGARQTHTGARRGGGAVCAAPARSAGAETRRTEGRVGAGGPPPGATSSRGGRTPSRDQADKNQRKRDVTNKVTKPDSATIRDAPIPQRINDLFRNPWILLFRQQKKQPSHEAKTIRVR